MANRLTANTVAEVLDAIAASLEGRTYAWRKLK